MTRAEHRRHHQVIVECAASGFDRASSHLGSLAERHGLVMHPVTPALRDGNGPRVSLRAPRARTRREARDFVTEIIGRLPAGTAPFEIVG